MITPASVFLLAPLAGRATVLRQTSGNGKPHTFFSTLESREMREYVSGPVQRSGQLLDEALLRALATTEPTPGMPHAA